MSADADMRISPEVTTPSTNTVCSIDELHS